jgi:hypothetical protein
MERSGTATPTKGGRRRSQRQEQQLPTWRNTRPRGNAEIDREDFERGRARWESLLGR